LGNTNRSNLHEHYLSQHGSDLWVVAKEQKQHSCIDYAHCSIA
jgi:hypothetical protein